jgi:hypothetical protein
MRFPTVEELINSGNWEWYHDNASLYTPGRAGYLDPTLLRHLGREVESVPCDAVRAIRKGLWSANLDYRDQATEHITEMGYRFVCGSFTSGAFAHDGSPCQEDYKERDLRIKIGFLERKLEKVTEELQRYKRAAEHSTLASF